MYDRKKNNIKATAAAQIFISVTFFLEVRVNKTSRRRIIFCIVKHITPGLTVLLLLEHRPLQREDGGMEGGMEGWRDGGRAGRSNGGVRTA